MVHVWECARYNYLLKTTFMGLGEPVLACTILCRFFFILSSIYPAKEAPTTLEGQDIEEGGEG